MKNSRRVLGPMMGLGVLVFACGAPLEEDTSSLTQELDSVTNAVHDDSPQRLAQVSGEAAKPCDNCSKDASDDGCSGYVIDEMANDGTVTPALYCEGRCPDSKEECKKHIRENQHGGLREWCGCSDSRRTDCHVVIYRPGEAEGGGDDRVACAGACEDGATCQKRKVEKKNAEGEVVAAVTCQCG